MDFTAIDVETANNPIRKLRPNIGWGDGSGMHGGTLSRGRLLLHGPYNYEFGYGGTPGDRMRRALLGISLACFVSGTACFGVFLLQVARIMAKMPSHDIDQLMPQVVPVQRWGWYFLGLCIGGFVLLSFVRDPGSVPPAERGAAPDRGPCGGGGTGSEK